MDLVRKSLLCVSPSTLPVNSMNYPITKKKMPKIHLKKEEVFTSLITAFKKIFVSQCDMCIDESLLLWKGRLGFHHYIPSKRKRFEIKLMLCNVLFILGLSSLLSCTLANKQGMNGCARPSLRSGAQATHLSELNLQISGIYSPTAAYAVISLSKPIWSPRRIRLHPRSGCFWKNSRGMASPAKSPKSQAGVPQSANCRAEVSEPYLGSSVLFVAKMDRKVMYM